MNIAQRIREAVRTDSIEHSVSIGISPILKTQLQTSRAVDRALYDAKEQGRDRVVVAGA